MLGGMINMLGWGGELIKMESTFLFSSPPCFLFRCAATSSVNHFGWFQTLLLICFPFTQELELSYILHSGLNKR